MIATGLRGKFELLRLGAGYLLSVTAEDGMRYAALQTKEELHDALDLWLAAEHLSGAGGKVLDFPLA